MTNPGPVIAMSTTGVFSLFQLAGKVALVTGATGGIGRAVASVLAEAGAAVVLVGRDSEKLAAAKDDINQKGGQAGVVTCDLTDRGALVDCCARAVAFFGPPDILVSAAGVNIRKPMLEVTENDWDATIKVNLEAPFFLAQRLAPSMIEKRWGRVINIASLQSVRAFPNSGPYGASKGGIVQLTRAQAEAWSRYGVNTNAIAPGFFATALTAPIVNEPASWAAVADRTFIGRNGRLEDLTGAVIFLASRASDYITGQTIFVDGGFSAG